jgi:hypothetical protein
MFYTDQYRYLKPDVCFGELPADHINIPECREHKLVYCIRLSYCATKEMPHFTITRSLSAQPFGGAKLR